ncbi:phosphatase PAP2 family protein [Gaiella sp.]|uniref:phosphatase PAP2 family protein n=1 Tax=Gaiella sp. TaxID=2663207 RepID=UPI0032679B42
MPFLILIISSGAFGAAVFFAASRYPTATGAPPPASAAAGRQLSRETVRHPALARLLRGRLDPGTATGLALTLALALAIIGGLMLGALAYLIRSNARLVELDASVGQWGADNGSDRSTQLLQLVTDLASTPVTIAVIAVVAIVAMARLPNRWILPFLITVVLGEVILVNTIKQLLDRVRPTFNPITETLGPSFPSGHSATAAALYAGAALVLARGRSPRTRALLAGGAAAIAVGVACSRVMLGVHWLSDVIAGLAFGWAWFSVCAIAFGGRFLRFGAPVEKAERVAERLPEAASERSVREGSTETP